MAKLLFKKPVKRPALALVLACYAAGLLVFAAAHLLGFVQNRLAWGSGALQTRTLSLADFDLYDLELQEDGTLLSVGGDPRLVLRDASLRVENVALHLSYRLDPLVVNVFWAPPGQDYSTRRMAYGAPLPADPASPGQQVFWLPPAGGQSLRIDPGTQAGNTITVHSITVNQPRAFWRFFLPSAGEGFLLGALPALAASGLALLGRLLPARPTSRPRGKAGAPHDG